MSINEEALKTIESLKAEYERIYGNKPDLHDASGLRGLTQERMVKVLERMIERNESLLTAYEKIYSQS